MSSLANRRMASMESLSLPRRQKVFDTTLVPDGDPLPLWTKLPLDSKLPVVPSPQGSYTLYTTKIGEPKYISKQHYDFNLYDPMVRSWPYKYDSLHDPYLRTYFDNPRTRKQLLHNDLITRDGKVKCDIKEFNDFREYIRYRAATELSLQRNRARPEESWLGRNVKSEDVRHKYGSRETLNYSKMSERDKDSISTADRMTMYGRDVSLVQRLRMREDTLMRTLEDKQREREESHRRRIQEGWEERKRRQARVLRLEQEIDSKMREERLQHIMQREKTLKKQRDRLMAKLSKTKNSKGKTTHSRGTNTRNSPKKERQVEHKSGRENPVPRSSPVNESRQEEEVQDREE